MNGATELLIQAYSVDTGDDLGQFYIDLVDGETDYEQDLILFIQPPQDE